MKKKMKDKEGRRHEDTLNFLLPSPPQQKLSFHPYHQELQHFHSSSSPVGRPPPSTATSMDNYIMDDETILEQLKILLASSTTTVATANDGQSNSSPSLLPSFIEQEQMDVQLFNMDDMDDTMDGDDSLNLFHDLPNDKS